jgi:prepilin-type N-terminal cleavage/methylation domain-containing protein
MTEQMNRNGMCMPQGVPPRSNRNRRGFSLIELMVVVAIVAVIAALAFSVLTSIRQRNAVSMGPQQLAQAMEYARDEAFATGRDTLFVIVGNLGAQDAYRCLGRIEGGFDVAARATGSDVRSCVRYWVLSDLPGAPFDLNAFDFNTAPTRRDLPTAQGDIVLEHNVLPGSIYLGRHPSYVPPPTIPPASVFASLNPLLTTPNCSFCSNTGAGQVPRGVIRFTARGDIRIGQVAAPPDPTAGLIFLNAADGRGQPVGDTRVVAILAPKGLITTRIAATQ